MFLKRQSQFFKTGKKVKTTTTESLGFSGFCPSAVTSTCSDCSTGEGIYVNVGVALAHHQLLPVYCLLMTLELTLELTLLQLSSYVGGGSGKYGKNSDERRWGYRDGSCFSIFIFIFSLRVFYLCKCVILNPIFKIISHNDDITVCSLTMRVVPAAVLWRQDQGTGSGNGSHISFGEERYRCSSGETKQWGGHVGPPVSWRHCRTWRVAEGAGRHGDGLPGGVLLGVAFCRNLLADRASCAQTLVQVLLCRWSGGCDPCGAAVVWSGGHGSGRRSV